MQNSKRDDKTDSILNILDNATWFEGKLIEGNLQDNLRTFVAHKQSISERLETYLQVHRLSQDKVLLYDMVSKGFLFSRQHMKWGRTFRT